MLVRGGVIHDLGPELPHRPADTRLVADVRKDGALVAQQAMPMQLKLEGVEGRLVMVKLVHNRGIEGLQLADDLATDRSSGPGDEDSFARGELTDFRAVRSAGTAIEQFGREISRGCVVVTHQRHCAPRSLEKDPRQRNRSG